VLGLFTIVRLVDTGIENQEFLKGIARIRGYYRTLTPEAAEYFSAESGRWPEARSVPPLWSGALVALLTTAARRNRGAHGRLPGLPGMALRQR
jgi:hypothetical protein